MAPPAFAIKELLKAKVVSCSSAKQKKIRNHKQEPSSPIHHKIPSLSNAEQYQHKLAFKAPTTTIMAKGKQEKPEEITLNK
jgi:hypothetical protein